MPKYRLTITRTSVWGFTVEAPDKNSAKYMADFIPCDGDGDTDEYTCNTRPYQQSDPEDVDYYYGDLVGEES